MSKNAENIVRKLTQKGHTAYFAGGCVRDMLLNRTAKDIDIATSALPDQVQELFPSASDLQGKVFGVVRIRSGEEVFEVATFRKDGDYIDGRRPESVTFTTAEEDAKRRDFTVNGLFYDPLKKEIIDYVEGRADLEKKVLRAIGDPVCRFNEDKLRILRAVRFAAELDFGIDAATWKSICEMSKDTTHLAPERVREELTKCFTGSHPQRAFDLLDESGLMKIWLPEVSLQKGVEQPPQFHPEGDVYTHVRMMMGMLRNPSLVLAWSVLLHDIGKPKTFKIDPTGRIRFNEHETVGARMAAKLLQRFRFSNQQMDDICVCIANHMAFKDVPNMRLSTLKRMLARPTIDDEIELHRIDCSASHGGLDIYDLIRAKKEELSQEEIKPVPLIKGSDVLALGIPASPRVGKILALLEEEQLEGKLADREQALSRLREIVEKNQA